MFSNYKQQADKNKEKIIKQDVKRFKKKCIKEFRENIKKGIDTTYIDFAWKVSSDFEEEISERVLKELKQEYPNIEFSFSYRHYMNSYKGIKMVAL